MLGRVADVRRLRMAGSGSAVLNSSITTAAVHFQTARVKVEG